MAGKSFKEYPFKIVVVLPKGHFLGNKSSLEMRSFLYRTIKKALSEYDSISKTGPLKIQLINRKTKEIIK